MRNKLLRIAAGQNRFFLNSIQAIWLKHKRKREQPKGKSCSRIMDLRQTKKKVQQVGGQLVVFNGKRGLKRICFIIRIGKNAVTRKCKFLVNMKKYFSFYKLFSFQCKTFGTSTEKKLPAFVLVCL